MLAYENCENYCPKVVRPLVHRALSAIHDSEIKLLYEKEVKMSRSSAIHLILFPSYRLPTGQDQRRVVKFNTKITEFERKCYKSLIRYL